MTTQLTSCDQRDELSSANRRRSPWRRRLVEAERGLTLGFRGDGTLFVYLFAFCLVVAASLVLGLSATRWAMLIIALTLALTAELFNKLLRLLCREAALRHQALSQAASIGTAATVVAALGAVAVTIVVLGERLQQVLKS